MTNCANVTPARSATSAVASNVEGRSLGSPKMNEPRTCTPWSRNVRSRVHQRLADLVEALVDVLQPFGRDRLDADERALDVAPAASRRGTPRPRPPPW